MRIRRICITGAASMIGEALTQYALDCGAHVLAVTRPGGRTLPPRPHCTVIACDLADLHTLRPAHECDALVHLAWGGTYGAQRDETAMQADNIRYTLDAARLAHTLGCACFLFVGSQAEYGPCSSALRPDTPTFPRTGYGSAKLAAGALSRILCRELGMRHVHARVLSVYGGADRPGTLVSACVDAMRLGRAPALTACTQMWDYLYVRDAARALYSLCADGRDGGIYPVGSGVCRPLREYVEQIRALTGCAAPPLYGARPIAPDSVTYLCADLSALTADTGFVPAYSFADGVREVIRDRSQ